MAQTLRQPVGVRAFPQRSTLYVNFAEHTHAQARSEFERALAINPAYAPALCLLGYTLIDQARFGWEKNQAKAFEAALECADRDLATDPNSYLAYRP